MRRSTALVLGALVVAAGAGPAPSDAADLVLLRARCVDPIVRTIEERSLWIENGVLSGLGAPDGTGLPEASAGAPRVDLAGAYVIPALADAWVHAGTQRSPGHRDRVGAVGTAQLALAAGVAEFVDVHLGAEAHVERERAVSSGPPRARLVVGGPMITARGGVASDFPGARSVRDATEAAALVDSLAVLAPALRPDRLAFVFDGSRSQPRLGVDALRAGIERASHHGLQVAVQVGTWRDVHDALQAGARWFVQLPFGPVPEVVARELARSEVQWTPTLAIAQDFASLLTQPALRSDPLLVALVPEALLADYAQVRVPQGRLAEVAQRRTELAANLTILRESGVRLRAGSSAGAVGTAFGWSLLRELEWMVGLGVNAWEALASALPARIEGGSSFGIGVRTDLLVIPRSPVDDITALRDLEAVVYDGERLDPRALAAAVTRTIEEEIPPSPLPFGGRVPMIVLVVVGFAVLLVLRRAVKRAAERAAGAS